jgi:hypothetical protein
MSDFPAAAALAPNTLPPLAAEEIILLGAPLWAWQVAVAVAGVLALVLLARTIWNPTPRSLRAWTLGNIAVNAGIAVTGATVRVTESGLGCSEWPKCTPESFVPIDTGHAAFNAAVEFGNRTLTFVVLAVAVITFIAVMRMTPRRRDLVRMAAIIPFGVLGQGVVGGITVWTDLHPASVATHFLLSMVMTFITVALYVRCREPEGKPQVSVGPMLHAISVGLVVIGFLLLVAGTVVTGSGPALRVRHPGRHAHPLRAGLAHPGRGPGRHRHRLPGRRPPPRPDQQRGPRGGRAPPGGPGLHPVRPRAPRGARRPARARLRPDLGRRLPAVLLHQPPGARRRGRRRRPQPRPGGAC